MLAILRFDNGAVGFMADTPDELPPAQFKSGETISVWGLPTTRRVTAQICAAHTLYAIPACKLPCGSGKHAYTRYYEISLPGFSGIPQLISELDILKENPRSPDDLFDYLM